MFETLGKRSRQIIDMRMQNGSKLEISRQRNFFNHTLEFKLQPFEVFPYVCIGKPCVCNVLYPWCALFRNSQNWSIGGLLALYGSTVHPRCTVQLHIFVYFVIRFLITKIQHYCERGYVLCAQAHCKCDCMYVYACDTIVNV